jgi:hypothetical protein
VAKQLEESSAPKIMVDEFAESENQFSIKILTCRAVARDQLSGGRMPEEPEIETEKLHEAIKEELEHGGGALLRQIALTTALFAAIAALASLRAGSTVNEALVLKTEAARLQSEASDQWAYYQAKGVKAAVEEASRTAWLAVGKEPPSSYEQNQKRYSVEQSEIQRKARELERDRDERSKEANRLLHIHHWFAYTVAILQIAIALGAIGALTRNRIVWAASLVAGVGAVVLFVRAILN